MAGSADRCSDHPGSDEVREAIIWRADRRESGNRSTPIGHDHFFAGMHAVDVLAQPVLEFADSDLRPRSSYFHVFIVATTGRLSTRQFKNPPPPCAARAMRNDSSVSCPNTAQCGTSSSSAMAHNLRCETVRRVSPTAGSGSVAGEAGPVAASCSILRVIPSACSSTGSDSRFRGLPVCRR